MMKKIQVSGPNFYCLDEGEGEPVLLLHGYPDSNKLWRNQVPALRDAGYRVIAPDLRGFGESSKPQNVEAYSLEILVGDVLGILDALNINKVKMIGHDFGAFLGWGLCLTVPDRITKYVALAVGHPGSFFNAGIKQKQLSWYTHLFQIPGVDELIKADNWKFFRELTQHHSEVDHWIKDLERPGAMNAGLNWYRANANLLYVDTSAFPKSRVPTTGVWANRDDYATELQMVNTVELMDAPWKYRRLEGAGHWMQLDRPDALNQILLEELSS